MKVESWDPDLQSLVARHDDGSLDLQPSFQRGLVWNDEKKARLIDTVLRGWRIPPVHYLVEPDESLSILDGQQRLQALFDFVRDKWPLRAFPPYDDDIANLDGLTFSGLPQIYQRRLMSSRVSGYRLSDYDPSEPYELFFRLNLPTGLTQAEKRNALAGQTREQVKELVHRAVNLGWSKELLGFGDGRLAYDDVIARTCMYLRAGSIKHDLTPSEMEHAYRDHNAFSPDIIQWAEKSIDRLTFSLRGIADREGDTKLRLNKATLLTWLLVSARSTFATPGLQFDDALKMLESARNRIGRRDPEEIFSRLEDPIRLGPLVSLYANRSSLRVADVLSVQARDAVAWLAIAETNSRALLPPTIRDLDDSARGLRFSGPEAFEADLLNLIDRRPEWSVLR